MKKFALLIVSLYFLVACEQKHFYNKYQSVDINAWKSTDTLSFPIKIETENTNYQYSLSVRYSKDYEFSNLWLKVFINGNNTDTSFRYEIPLFKKDGKPYGKSSGSLCTQTVPLKTTLSLHQKGEYKISIVQLMRKDPLNGISDVGLLINQQ